MKTINDEDEDSEDEVQPPREGTVERGGLGPRRGGMRRGRGRGRGAGWSYRKVDVQGTLHSILRTGSEQQEEAVVTTQEDVEQPGVFSHSAAMLARHVTDQLTAAGHDLPSLMAQMTAALHLRWVPADSRTHFLHGELTSLIQAQEVLSKIREGLSVEEGFATQNIQFVIVNEEDLVSEDLSPIEQTDVEPQCSEVPIEHSLSTKTQTAVSACVEQNETGEGPVCVDQMKEEVMEQVPEVQANPADTGYYIEDAAEGEGDGLGMQELIGRLNPTTLENYPRSSAIFTNPDMATIACDICGFVSTEKGMAKHKVRKHPELVFECEVCLDKFGVRYDMRKHRLKHFDTCGILKAEFVSAFRRKFPEMTGEITLGVLEAQFTPPDVVKEGVKEEEVDENKAADKSGLLKPRKRLSLKIIKKIHLCDECDFQGPSAGLAKHKKQKHPRMLYNCPKCPFELGELMLFLKHYSRHEDPVPHIKDIIVDELGDICECTSCGMRGTVDAITSHISIKHPHHLTCRTCDITFLNQRTLQRHFQVEHRNLYRFPVGKTKRINVLQLPRDASRCACEVCGKEVRLSWYHTHLKTHNRQTLRCQYCGFETWKKFEMKNHLLIKHGPKQFMCHICGQTFSYKSAHANHLMNKHPDTPQVFPCPHCDKKFSVKRFMTTHVKRMHLHEKKYFCDVCNRGFFEQIRMKQHKEVHASYEERQANKQFECGECGSRFRDMAKLQQHCNVHAGLKPYKCDMCSAAFAWRAELTKHTISKHTEERPYRCTVCHKSFKFRYKLTTHMITHTRQSRHTCGMCGKAFTQKATLKKHRCRTAMYTVTEPGMIRDIVDGTTPFMQLHNEHGQTEEIYIQLEDPPSSGGSGGTEAAVGMDSLAQLEAAGAGSEDGTVTFMCGMCQGLFTTAAEINDHVLSEHGETVMLVVESRTTEMDNEVGVDPQENGKTEELAVQGGNQEVQYELEGSADGEDEGQLVVIVDEEGNEHQMHYMPQHGTDHTVMNVEVENDDRERVTTTVVVGDEEYVQNEHQHHSVNVEMKAEGNVVETGVVDMSDGEVDVEGMSVVVAEEGFHMLTEETVGEEQLVEVSTKPP